LLNEISNSAHLPNTTNSCAKPPKLSETTRAHLGRVGELNSLVYELLKISTPKIAGMNKNSTWTCSTIPKSPKKTLQNGARTHVGHDRAIGWHAFSLEQLIPNALTKLNPIPPRLNLQASTEDESLSREQMLDSRQN
jgi:hypothetical protein